MYSRKSTNSGVPPAFWRRLERVLERHRKKVEADTRRVLQEVLSDDVRLAMLAAMTEGQNRQVQ